jgi:Xaa-Pro aminopeptidase
MFLNDAKLIRQKIAQATQILQELNIDLWLTFARETSMVSEPALDLILGQSVTWHSAFLLTSTGRHIAIVGHFDAENIRDLGAYEQVIGYHKGLSKHLRTALDSIQPKSIAINFSERDVAADGLTFGNYLTLLKILEGTPYPESFVSAEAIIAAVRGRKISAEVERIRRAITATEALFAEIDAYVRPGMTQRQIANFLQGRIEEEDYDYAWEKSVDPIVTCGPHSNVGHATPGDIELEKGHTLHIDLGVKIAGYCSDLQRMWYVLEDGELEAPPEVQHAFSAVLGAIQEGEAALRPGVAGWQVDAAARGFIIDAGYPEYMHALGHLLGRAAHDGATVLAPQWERYDGICQLAVEEGNVFTLELHVPIPERGIMSLEEDVLVTKDGTVYLSNPQREIRYISAG